MLNKVTATNEVHLVEKLRKCVSSTFFVSMKTFLV